MAAQFFQSAFSAQVQLLPADTTVLKTVTTLTTFTRITQIIVTSTDSSARDLQLVATIGGTDYILNTISIPANSGNTNSVQAVMLLRSAQWNELNNDIANNKVLELPSGTVIKVKVGTTITAARVISIVMTGEGLT
jgi:hypothetical protein